MAQLLGAFNALNARCELWTQQPRVCRLMGQPRNRCKTLVDGRCRQIASLQVNAIPNHHDAIKGKSWL
jgi:hypothetical protein